MARADGPITYTDAVAVLAEPKTWGGGTTVNWVPENDKPNGFPMVAASRSSIIVNRNNVELRPEGWWITCYLKQSLNPGIPPKLYYNFIAVESIVYAHHDGPDSKGHKNDGAGAGQPHHMKRVGHPHIHLPMPDGVGSYVTPAPRLSPEDMWTAFLNGINMTRAPDMVLPSPEPTQQGLDL